MPVCSPLEHDARTGDLRWTIEIDHTEPGVLLFDREGGLLLAKTEDAIGVYQAGDGERLRTIDVGTAVLSHDEETLVTTTRTHTALTLRRHLLATGQQVDAFEHDMYSVEIAAFSDDERLLATGSRDEVLRLWSAETGRCPSTGIRHSTVRWSRVVHTSRCSASRRMAGHWRAWLGLE